MAWENRRAITIDHNQVIGSADLTNYIFYFSNTNTDFATIANGGLLRNASGFDVRFTSDSAGSNVLSYEKDVHNLATGELKAWVKIPTLDFDDNTVIYIWYSNNTISTNQEDVVNVWADYLMVTHLSDLTTSTVKDSKGTYTLAKKGANTPVEATGYINTGQDFNASNAEHITTPTATALNPTASVTVQAIFKSDLLTSRRQIAGKIDANNGYHLRTDGTNLQFRAGSGATLITAQSAVTTGTWYIVTGVYDGANTKLYVNGVLTDTSGTTIGAIATNTVEFSIGAFRTTFDYFDGIIDEVRLLDTAHTVERVGTEYNNYSSPPTFYTLGVKEVVATLPTVTTGSIINITHVSASGGGSVTNDGGIPVTERGVVFSTSPNPTIADNKGTTSSGAGAFASNMLGLALGTLYYVRAYATNGVGTSYGAQSTFTTLSITQLGSFGKLTAGATTTSTTLDKLVISSGVMPNVNAAMLVSITCRLSVSAISTCNIRAVIYSDNSGPDQLMAVSEATVISNTTVQAITMPIGGAISLAPSAIYWIGFHMETPTNGATLVFERDNSANLRRELNAPFASPSPSPFGAGTLLSGAIACYATYRIATPGGVTKAYDFFGFFHN
jgi:hypothetical protein